MDRLLFGGEFVCPILSGVKVVTHRKIGKVVEGERYAATISQDGPPFAIIEAVRVAPVKLTLEYLTGDPGAPQNFGFRSFFDAAAFYGRHGIYGTDCHRVEFKVVYEYCGCCDGTGTIEGLDDDDRGGESCMTCNGKGGLWMPGEAR